MNGVKLEIDHPINIGMAMAVIGKYYGRGEVRYSGTSLSETAEVIRWKERDDGNRGAPQILYSVEIGEQWPVSGRSREFTLPVESYEMREEGKTVKGLRTELEALKIQPYTFQAEPGFGGATLRPYYPGEVDSDGRTIRNAPLTVSVEEGSVTASLGRRVNLSDLLPHITTFFGGDGVLYRVDAEGFLEVVAQRWAELPNSGGTKTGLDLGSVGTDAGTGVRTVYTLGSDGDLEEGLVQPDEGDDFMVGKLILPSPRKTRKSDLDRLLATLANIAGKN
ncbi:hypothetical protein HYU13_06740 [Candidatus Woesearchaeota archaeon]|nr:hypothetical protein [Candidatus Woesearchaeota archaeon]